MWVKIDVKISAGAQTLPHVNAASLLDYSPDSSSAVESEHYIEKY